jgi:tRNA A-37 threonylcarbamoyl transferase component Bud32
MKASTERLIQIFHAAKAMVAGPERDRFLADTCCDDAELKEQVLSLLEADEQSGDFLKQPLPRALDAVAERPGENIGHYKLLEKIGEGGCGVVYMAEQEQPIRRRVALKIIKLGMDTRQVVARFEAERQALAMMDHPNIAKVLDAGATHTGRPFFVMELVRGIKITDYCDQNQFSTTERLGLFVQVCQAIQHAHQKGVIHRDIKPSNILVAQHDSVAVPKVIDFGIAKATTGQQLTDKTVFTAFEQFMGTPAYMSPEQAHWSDAVRSKGTAGGRPGRDAPDHSRERTSQTVHAFEHPSAGRPEDHGGPATNRTAKVDSPSPRGSGLDRDEVSRERPCAPL